MNDPAAVDAIQWTGNNIDAVVTFVGDRGGSFEPPFLRDETGIISNPPGAVTLTFTQRGGPVSIGVTEWIVQAHGGLLLAPWDDPSFTATYALVPSVQYALKRVTP